MSSSSLIDRRFSVAPMMAYTDRHFRFLARCLSSKTLLYTEMITADALCYGDAAHHLQFSPQEQPVALQLGGADPAQLANAAALGEAAGYVEINLNVGCPSDRVQSGEFGACLMKKPAVVARAVAAMQRAVAIPVTVKTRLGVDECDSYPELVNFMQQVADAGCQVFILHARKAWLSGLNPAQNRSIPPLRYERVYQLKQDFPQLTLIINGGITSLDAAASHLQRVDGVMIGRAAYHNPFLLAEVDALLGDTPSSHLSRAAVARQYLDYLAQQAQHGVSLTRMTRALMGLYAGQPGARRWRGLLSNGLVGKTVTESIARLQHAIAQLEQLASLAAAHDFA